MMKLEFKNQLQRKSANATCQASNIETKLAVHDLWNEFHIRQVSS